MEINISKVKKLTLETHFQGERLLYRNLAKDSYEKLVELQRTIEKSGIDELLFELIKIRASLINGCAFCFDMHI